MRNNTCGKRQTQKELMQTHETQNNGDNETVNERKIRKSDEEKKQDHGQRIQFNQRGNTEEIMCKYGKNCRRETCLYNHLCRFEENCTKGKKDCYYEHKKHEKTSNKSGEKDQRKSSICEKKKDPKREKNNMNIKQKQENRRAETMCRKGKTCKTTGCCYN